MTYNINILYEDPLLTSSSTKNPVNTPRQPTLSTHPTNTSFNRLCSDWLEARATRDAPPGAPANWGCPRGHKCPFAHGEAELEGDGKEAMEQVSDPINTNIVPNRNLT